MDHATSAQAVPIGTAKTRDVFMAAALFGTLACGLVALIVLREGSMEQSHAHAFKIGVEGLRWRHDDTDRIMGVLSALTAAGLMIAAALRATRLWSRPLAQRCLRAGLVILLLCSGFTWLYGARGIARADYIKGWDSFHYLLGAKYFPELGYAALYDCVAAADQETVHRLRRARVRDLRDYDRRLPAEDAARRGLCHERFSKGRWAAFKHDYRFFVGLMGRMMRDMVQDRGYNGTPFNAFVLGHVGNAFEVGYRSLSLFTLVDTLGVLLMLFALGATFGWELSAVAALLFFTTFSDRAHSIQGSFLRYHWFYLTGLGVAALGRGRYGTGGVLVATAGMLNVFPLLFLGGIAIKGGSELVLRRSFSPRYRRFAFGTALALTACFGLSLTLPQGLRNYRDFFDDMEQHAGLMTFSRSGLKYAFTYRGEMSEDQFSQTYSIVAAKQRRPYYYAALGLLLAVLVVLARRLDDVQATILIGFAAFFYLFTTVAYYYGLYALLMLLWQREQFTPTLLLLIALPFALNAGVHWLYQASDSRGIATNTGMSFAVLCTLLLYQARLLATRSPDARAELLRRGALAALGLVALGTATLTAVLWGARPGG